MADGTVMIIGLGEVGGKALELLARKPGIARIIGADVNEAYALQKVNNAAFGAQLEGYYPNIDFVKYAKRLGHPEGHYLVASSAIQKILSLYYDTGEISHVAGPGGLVGGFPVRLNQEGVKLALPREISQEEAIRINWESQRLEGIEEIKKDGQVVFSDKSCQIMKELLGYECKTMKPDEYEEKASELGRRYEEFSKKYLS